MTLDSKKKNKWNITLPTPEKRGYTFSGWVSVKKPSTKLDNNHFYNQTATKNVILNARWTINEYNITYNMKSGYFNTEEPVYSYTIASEAITFPTPVKKKYVFDGWYTSSNYSGNKVTGIAAGSTGDVILYAKWKKNIIYKYNVCYYDKQNNLQIINSYEVQAGEKFNDYLNYAKKRNDGLYTPIRFLNESGEVWDENFTHPGGDSNLDINVIVEYIEGDFALVSTAEQLRQNKNRNIYLLNDIDLGGEEFPLKDYRYELVGNGKTISNCIVTTNPTKYGLSVDHTQDGQNSLYVSLFGNIKNATIIDVTFDNVVFEIKSTFTNTYKIYVSPICTKLENCIIDKVTINVTYKCVELPSGFDIEENLVFVTDEAYLIDSSNNTVTNNKINILEINLGGQNESETN